MKVIIILLFISFCIFQNLWSQSNLLSNPPKDKAEIFAKDILSSPDKEHGKLSVAFDGKSIYWDCIKLPYNEGDPQNIVCISQKDKGWGDREIAEFNGKYWSWSACFLEKNKIVFGSKKNIGTDSVVLKDEFWIVERRNEGWTEPCALGFDQFSETRKWSFSVSSTGNIYFDDKNYEKGQYGWGMYVSYCKNGKYEQPVSLPEHINTEYFDWTPFIALDESYLLFSSNRPGSMGSTDIYVTFRNTDRSWLKPINLGEKVNSKHLERWPSVSPDGRILFFQRDYIVDDKLKEQDYYWIDAKIIEELRPKE